MRSDGFRRIGIIVDENEPLAGFRRDERHGFDRMAVNAKMVPAKRIDDDEDDVGGRDAARAGDDLRYEKDQ